MFLLWQVRSLHDQKQKLRHQTSLASSLSTTISWHWKTFLYPKERITVVPPVTLGSFFLDIQNMLAIVSPSSLWNVERAVRLTGTNSLEGEAIGPWQARGDVPGMAINGKAARWLSACHQNKASLRRAWEWGRCKVWTVFYQKEKLSRMFHEFQSSMMGNK